MIGSLIDQWAYQHAAAVLQLPKETVRSEDPSYSGNMFAILAQMTVGNRVYNSADSLRLQRSMTPIHAFLHFISLISRKSLVENKDVPEKLKIF